MTEPIKTNTHTLHNKPKTTTINDYRFFIGAFDNDENTFHDILDKLLSSNDSDTLELRIGSTGGLITEAQQIINIIRNNFKGRNTAYIDSHASSAGAITFCACERRVIYENSRLMLHNYSGGHNGSHQKMKDRMKFDTKHIIGFIKSTLNVGNNSFLTKKEFKKMVQGKEFWFDADDMIKRGIATHIIINGKEISCEGLKGVPKR